MQKVGTGPVQNGWKMSPKIVILFFTWTEDKICCNEGGVGGTEGGQQVVENAFVASRIYKDDI